MELCDYTLDEYVGIVRLDHRQDPLSANRLAWQLLKGLKYLHSNFAVPHGNLMVGALFKPLLYFTVLPCIGPG